MVAGWPQCGQSQEAKVSASFIGILVGEGLEGFMRVTKALFSASRKEGGKVSKEGFMPSV
jgi:hypothetical protein